MEEQPEIEIALTVDGEKVYRLSGKSADARTTARFSDTITILEQEAHGGITPLYNDSCITNKTYVSTRCTIDALLKRLPDFRDKEAKIEVLIH